MRGKGGRGKEVGIHVQNGDTRPVIGGSTFATKQGRRNVSQVDITTVAGKREKNRVMILIGSGRGREIWRTGQEREWIKS